MKSQTQLIFGEGAERELNQLKAVTDGSRAESITIIKAELPDDTEG